MNTKAAVTVYALEIPIKDKRWRLEVMHLPDRVKPLLCISKADGTATTILARFEDDKAVDLWNTFLGAMNKLEEERATTLRAAGYPVRVDTETQEEADQ